MARAYSDDLRRKLLEAHLAGKGTLAELAGQFGVSDRWAWKVSSAYRRTGSMARTPQRRHGVIAAKVDERVRALVANKPDIVLREMQAEFQADGHSISIPHLWRTLKRLGLRLKKSRSTPPSAPPKRTGGDAKRSSPSSARSRRKT